MSNCKRLVFIFFSLLFAANVFAQEVNMTGLWSGLMYNDTTGLNYRYEIAVSEKNGNYSGYSQTFFILDGKEYYGVKKIKITIDGNKLVTQDIKLLDNNYPIKPPKGVYMINVLNFEMKNDVLILSGMFETNRTRVYTPVTGYVHVEKKNDLKRSALLPQLESLGLADELSFVQEEKARTGAGVTKPAEPIAKIKPAEKEKKVKEKPAKEKEPPIAKAEPKTKETAETKPAENIKDRIIETIQSVNYRSDSLQIALYDNGEVDGDTVSVLMNGEVIMPRVGLSTNAVRKTIYTKGLADSIQIVMYAETLGSLPPNTGLLVVYDGKERYEIRFSGDLKKNAAIVFRRKEN